MTNFIGKRKISNEGLDFLKAEEGTVFYEYYCPAKKETIGVGCLTSMMTDVERLSTKKVAVENLNTIGNIKPVVENGFVMIASEELINSMLMRRLESFENAVNKSVLVDTNQNQFDALVSLIFNIGITAFKKSTLLRTINNNGGDEAVKFQFMRWIKAGGKPILKKRREKEVQLFFNAKY